MYNFTKNVTNSPILSHFKYGIGNYCSGYRTRRPTEKDLHKGYLPNMKFLLPSPRELGLSLLKQTEL